MAALRVADQVLAVDASGRLTFSEVILFLDRDPTAQALYYEIETESGNKITLTPSHLIFVADDNSTAFRQQISRATYAQNVQPGQFLYSSSSSLSRVYTSDDSGNNSIRQDTNDLTTEHTFLEKVVRVEAREASGVFAPLTRHGTVVVNNLVASCYAVIHHQTIAHWSFLPIRGLDYANNLYHYLAKTLHLIDDGVAIDSRETGVDNGSPEADLPQLGIHWYPRLLYSISDYVIPSSLMYQS